MKCPVCNDTLYKEPQVYFTYYTCPTDRTNVWLESDGSIRQMRVPIQHDKIAAIIIAQYQLTLVLIDNGVKHITIKDDFSSVNLSNPKELAMRYWNLKAFL